MTRLARRFQRFWSPLTLGSVLAIAIGVGVNTAEFTLLKHVFLPSMPFPRAEEIVFLSEAHRTQSAGDSDCSPGFYTTLKDRARSLSAISAYIRVDTDWALTGVPEPQRVKGLAATVELLPLLGIHRPAAGRLFAADDGLAGARRVALLSHAFWQRKFGGSKDVIGSNIRLRGKSYEVVGVVPDAAKYFPDAGDVWTVWIPQSGDAAEFGSLYLGVVGRRGRDVNPAALRHEVAAIHAGIVSNHPEMGDWLASVKPFPERIAGKVQQPLVLLGVATLGLALLCCVTTANLLNAFWHTRANELAIRKALGASRTQVVSAVVTDAFVCFGLGGVLALLTGRWVLDGTIASMPEGTFGPILPTIDWQTIAFAGGVTALVGGVASLAAGLALTRDLSIAEFLRPTAIAGGRLAYWRRGSVIVQVALSVVLVFGTMALMSGLQTLREPLVVLDGEKVLTFRVLSSDDSAEAQTGVSYQEALLERLKAIPGLTAVGVISSLPVRDDGPRIEIAAEGADHNLRWLPLITVASPRAFDAIGLRPLSGRLFTSADTSSSPPVAVISESMAKRVWPGQTPIHKRFHMNPRSSGQAWITVVAVVPDVVSPILGTAAMTAYLPYEQNKWDSATTFILRGQTNARDLVPTTSRAVALYDSALPVGDVATLEQVLSRHLATKEAVFDLVAGFAIVAAILVAVGTYGLTAGLVRLQRRSIAIRLALGAGSADVTKWLLGSTLWDVGYAALFGSSLCVPAALLFRQLLNVVPPNPWTVIAAVTFVVGVGVAGMMAPIARALRVDLSQLLKDSV